MSKYIGNPDYQHDTRPCLGVLLTNLGTPDAPNTRAVRKYLAEFLSDPRVIEVPRPLWWLILHGIILRFRPRSSAHAYSQVWTSEGSPLLSWGNKQARAILDELAMRQPGPIKIELAMRYGNPSIQSGLEKLRDCGAERILIFPLYPQYSSATTASTFDAVAAVMKTWRWMPELRMVTHYHDNVRYIEAVAESIRTYWQKHGQPEILLFSFHGLPEDYFRAGDPYHCECHKTARLVAENLELNDDQWQVCFQSRFGPRAWLKPYTDETLAELARNGIKKVNVICPGFSADCLETLEEINIRYREVFLENGGEQFEYIPALNDESRHIEALTDIIIQHCQGWPEVSSDWNLTDYESAIQTRQNRFKLLKSSSSKQN
ncbi:MAG TPA: ferrochelatase [Gammaproteobacteria bacterium]